MNTSALFALTLVLGLNAAGASDVSTGSPVERIVNLLKTLKEKSVADSKHEQQVYDKYACWCETTTKRKADDIDEARADLRSLGQRILKLKGTVATRAAEIAELSDEIKSNEDEQGSLTAVREKQNGAWAAETAEVKQALAALQAAIGVLAKATTPSLIQESEAQRLQSKYAVQNVLEKLPSRVGLAPGRMSLLSEFTSAAEGFAPQSATIQGMLGDMYLTFAANVESDTLEEANRNADFEKAYAGLEKASNKAKDIRDKKSTEKAEAEAMLADTTKAYEDTEKQMEADIEFFGETKDACMAKHEEWTVREKMRNAELDGMNKALELLTSDEARELFAASIKPGVGFLQISSTPALLQQSSEAPSAKAYNTLKGMAKKAHSVRFAALAVHIRSSKAGHFDKVIGEIDKMLSTLTKEGQDDQDKKDQCLEEYQEITKTVKDLDWKIKVNKAEIEKFEKLIELRTKEREETIQKIKETNQYIADITKQRKEENDDYLQAKKDDEAAVALLEKAKGAMAKFYEEQGIKVSFAQEPEFARSEDDAPDASLSSKGNNQNAAKTILSLFAYIIEDLTDELSNAKKDEANSQAEFEEEKATAEKLVDDLTEKKDTLKQIIAKRNDDKVEENKDMKENNVDRDAELKYQAKITPDCDWIIKNFDGRAEARAAEMAGLTTAKEFLAGRTALLQSKGKFDDTSFAKINFLGMH
jgi:septal ring factor EnvC (AmiA/AmiB activator)